jgi:hypothetical protein
MARGPDAVRDRRQQAGTGAHHFKVCPLGRGRVEDEAESDNAESRDEKGVSLSTDVRLDLPIPPLEALDPKACFDVGGIKTAEPNLAGRG